MFFTYAHYKPEGGLFYIGKGKRKRAYAMDRRNSHWQNIVNKYGKPQVKLLASWDTEKEAFEHEKLLIACFKDMGYELSNKSLGGEGTSGYKFTEQQKINLSKAHLGQIAWNKGLKGVQVAWNKGQKAHSNAYKALVQKVECPKCGKIGQIGGMKRFHMDNCGIVHSYPARVTVNGSRIQIGRFKTKEEAKMAQINYYKENSL